MKVAIVHYWFVAMRGGERVVEAISELFPEADIFAHVVDPGALSDALRRRTIKTTFIQRLPRARRWYKSYLPLMPMALEQIDLRGYDLVISSESGPAKGVIAPSSAAHVCYCHSPMRYLWDMYHDYQASAGPLTRLVAPTVSQYLRMWDVTSAARVDAFIANSAHTARRISRAYHRESVVVPPPVDTDAFTPTANIDDYYLCVGHLVGYKRVDLAIDACERLGRRLVVIGDGELLTKLRRRNLSYTTLLGHQSNAVITEHYARCRALLFPGEEDFGIVPVEAMASGRPVIAYGRGGAIETVVEGTTGLFFSEQTVDSLIDRIAYFEKHQSDFTTDACVRRAAQFSVQQFKQGFRRVVEMTMTGGHAPEGASASG